MKNLTAEQWRLIQYLNFKTQCVADQEEVGIRLDYDKAVRHRDELVVLQADKVIELQTVMPKTPITTKKEKPKTTHKKDGTLSKDGEKWFALLRENNLPITFNGILEVITGYKDANPNSPDQVKAWLKSFGWKPSTFKFVRDKKSGDERQIEQVRKGGELCPSVVRLASKVPEVKVLEGLSIIQHRLGMFKAFVSESYVKPDSNFNVPRKVYVKSKVGGGDGSDPTDRSKGGFTNTLRLKHKKPIANMPKVGVEWGEEIRGCLIATDGETFCGSDLTSLESTTKRHYMFKHDPEYVAEMSEEGFDEHLNLAVFAGAVTQQDVDDYTAGKATWVKGIRGPYKATNYSAVYGVGKAALARDLGIPVKDAAKLLKDYWERNWAVKEIAEEQVVKTIKNGEMWLFNPVSEFWISLRYEKDIFSSLNQSTGVFVFDTWLAYVKSKKQAVALQYHDEFLLRIKEGAEKDTEDVIQWAMVKTNEKIQLNVTIGCDSQFGENYAECH